MNIFNRIIEHIERGCEYEILISDHETIFRLQWISHLPLCASPSNARWMQTK